MQCPLCADEFEEGIALCTNCSVPLLPPGVSAPARTRHLGRFARPVGERVLSLLGAKSILYDVEERDDELAVRVDAEWRDDVASQLYTGWIELLMGLDRDVAYGIFEQGGTHPGWHDAPDEAWTDRQGRLKVDVEAADADGARAIGPALLVLGLALVLLGLVDAVSPAPALTFGSLLLVLGALLPR